MACILLPLLALASACQKTQPPPESSRTPAPESTTSPPRQRWITIARITAADGTICFSVSDPQAHVAEGDSVLWVNTVGQQVSVHFGAGSPFVPNNFQLDPGAVSGSIVRTGTLGQRFGYDLSPKGCPHTETGPDVIVDGGGVPGGKP